MTHIISNLQIIKQRILAAEQRFHRPPGSVKLVAVSKTQTPFAIEQIFTAGQKDIAENYLQEALPKISALSSKQLIWHFIGAIQTRKIKELAKNFSWVHTVCREKEALQLSHFRPDHLPPLNICIQVKLEKNTLRNGIAPVEVASLIQAIHALPRLCLRGLMVLPPYVEDFAQQRSFFRVIRELLTQLNTKGYELDTLSMGMTHDLEAAIAEGATMVRIGTGIFGSRK